MRRRSRLRGRRSLALLLVGASAAALAAWWVVGREGPLRAAGPLNTRTLKAHVGSTYNVPVQMRVGGSAEVQVLSARAVRTPAGLRQPDPVMAWGCDGKEWFGGAVGADLRGRRNTDIRDLHAVRIKEEHEDCFYLLLRFVPERLGTFDVSDVEIRYRAGGRTFTERFPFSFGLEVTNPTGPDPREWR